MAIIDAFKGVLDGELLLCRVLFSSDRMNAGHKNHKNPYVSLDLLHVSFSGPEGGAGGDERKGRKFSSFFSRFLFFFLLSPESGCGTCGKFNFS